MYDMGCGDPRFPFSAGHSGRKAYAGILSLLNIPYEEGFEMHADGFSTWETKYQNGCKRLSNDFTRRTQSDDVDVATRALRRMTQWLGFGKKQPVCQMSLVERQNDLLLWHFGYSKQCNNMLLGLNPDIPPMVYVGDAVKPEAIVPVKREKPKEERS